MRVKDIDFDYHQIVVRDGKGNKDRFTVLPNSLLTPLRDHLIRVKALHEKDLSEGYGRVALPYALEIKYPKATRVGLAVRLPVSQAQSGSGDWRGLSLSYLR